MQYASNGIVRTIQSMLGYMFFRRKGPQIYVSPVSFHAALLFPVHIWLALIEATSMCLSCIRVPVHKCDGYYQRSLAIRRRSYKFRRRNRLGLLGLLMLSNSNQLVHAIPSTGFGVSTERTNDNMRQERNVQTIIEQIRSSNPTPANSTGQSSPSSNQGPASGSTAPTGQSDASGDRIATCCSAGSKCKDPHLKGQPEVFVVDTDSIEYIIDTGTNGFIVNDSRLLKRFRLYKGKVKGVNGKPTTFHGIGKLKLTLRTDCGDRIQLEVDAVVVPTCPYNLLSPQLLIRELKRHDATAHCKYDDKTHSIHFSNGGKRRTITSFAKSNHLFSLRANEGYHSFFSHAVEVDPAWCSFAGAIHVIPDDEPGSPGDGKQREHAAKRPREDGPDKQREGPDQTMEPQSKRMKTAPTVVEDVSDSDSELDEKLTSEPRETIFEASDVRLGAEDDAMVHMRRKQQELSTYHEKYGHVPFWKLRLMARAGLIPRYLAKVPSPVCPGCAYGKAHRKPTRTKGRKGRLRVATKPGQVVSVDQLVSPTSGFVPTHRGIPTTKRYIGATVFVDHYSDFTYVHLMTRLNADHTVEAKKAFERIASKYGVKIEHYHSDNGLFDTKSFREHVQRERQTLSFCGPNAHHQNGKAENRIKDVTANARTSLLHAAHRWPQAVNVHLWPAALKNYTNIRNALPTRFTSGKQTGRRKQPDTYDDSPLSRFSGTPIEPNLDHFHPFGSPVYVLEQSLQEQKSHNKWKDRSRVGIFLCHSPNHATSVPLVLNTQTGNVAPQFHCIYDDQFTTCKRDAKFSSLWQYKAKLSKAPTPDVVLRRNASPTEPVATPVQHRASAPVPTPEVELPRLPEQLNPTPVAPTIDPNQNAQDPGTTTEAATPTVPQRQQQANPQQQEQPEQPLRTTRTGRVVRPANRLIEVMMSALERSSPHVIQDAECGTQLLQPNTEVEFEPHPLAMISSFVASSDPDTMTLEDAMKQPDREQFLEAMKKELNDHIGRKHWKVVPLKVIPKHKRAIPMVWSMKRKRDPVGNIIKWKARLCAGGHRSIEFVDFWSTYSPVVTWNTVRMMLTMALINDWHVRSIDFVLAYPQAPVKTDIYMKPPRVPHDFAIPDLPRPSDRITKCYQLIKNLYGLRDAGKTWFDFLNKGLIERGWKPSAVDTCLYTKPGIILMVYVDDAILISPHEPLINNEIKSLQRSYALTDDGPLKDYLGTRFIRHQDGSLEMTQPKMIERALEIVGLNKEKVKMHDTPAVDSRLLDRDPNAAPRKQSWNYRSAVGCLSYIQAMIRPDITMAVQQCARFCNDPKQEHEEAVKRICRYLVRTKDKGIVFKPDSSRGLECFVDADWAGSWQHRSANDPLSAHSRTGYVIMYAGCPIVWASKMQSLIALSTTEAEYIALSTALREVIAIKNLIDELGGRGFKFHGSPPKVVCRTFEDNRSCIEIATNHRTRPRTKHLSVRLHHFRSYVTDGSITIEHISTKEQIADLLTKPLPRTQFTKLRDRLMSWSLVSNREGVKE